VVAFSQSPPHSLAKKQETLRKTSKVSGRSATPGFEIARVWFSINRGRRTLACSSVHAFGGVSRVVEILSCSCSSADSPPPSGRRSKCERSSVCTKKHGTGRRKREEEIEGRRDGDTKEENLARVMASSMKVASVITTELGSC
jgi:hypothetical protein